LTGFRVQHPKEQVIERVEHGVRPAHFHIASLDAVEVPVIRRPVESDSLRLSQIAAC
jgi:hypothetical protein